MKRGSLRRRITFAVLGLALFCGLFGGLLAVLFAYTTEDHIFNRLATLEVERLQSVAAGASLPAPALPFTRYYTNIALPAALRDALEAEPARREVFGADGRHYHLRRVVLPGADESVWVVLQVEDLLAVRPALTGITLVLAASTIGLTLLAAAIGLLVAHRITAPLRALADEVAEVKPDALPDDWSRTYPPDETGRLADALRDAFLRIDAFIEREQRFTQDASHELRTPLAVIDSSAELLSKQPDAGQGEALIDRIRAAALSMHMSVDVLLALARERDPARPDTPFAVLPIIERTVVNHAALLAGKPVEVEVNVDADWRIAGDPGALQVLVANLVSNAFRYTDQGTIRIERDGQDLLIIDSGIGIDPALRPEVTRPSVKGHASPGLGLGLSIVERLCERCGWVFELHSSPKGTIARLALG